jgi:peptide/nickel transport system permease protein
MKRPTALSVLAVLLVGLHLVAALAGFLGPYDPSYQDRDLPWAPPSRLHFFSTEGFHPRPFVHPLVPDPENPRHFVENRAIRHPVHFLVAGDRYSFLGMQAELHLFGVDEPGRVSLLGRDGLGRDVFSRLLHGGRVSLLTGLLATLLAIGIGAFAGTISGYFGGSIDSVLMRLSELFMSLPWLYLLLAIRALLPLSITPTQTFLLLVALLGVVGWAHPARLIRGLVLSVRHEPYIDAARGMGVPTFQILLHHVLPQTGSVVLTQAAILIPQYVLAEVTLTFLGVGISEPQASWGNMLTAMNQYNVISEPYWWMLAPGVALLFLFVAYHLLARTLQQQAS